MQITRGRAIKFPLCLDVLKMVGRVPSESTKPSFRFRARQQILVNILLTVLVHSFRLTHELGLSKFIRAIDIAKTAETTTGKTVCNQNRVIGILSLIFLP